MELQASFVNRWSYPPMLNVKDFLKRGVDNSEQVGIVLMQIGKFAI